MRKRTIGGRLGRTYGARRGLLRGLFRSLVLHGAIETSGPRAKTLRGFVDRLVTVAKKGTLAARRQVLSSLAQDEEIASKLFQKIPAFGARASGFTRSIPLGSRRGDSSFRVRIEWTDKEERALKVSKVSEAPQKADKKIKNKK